MGKVNKEPFKASRGTTGLAVSLLKMVAVGVAGGAALLAGSKKVGDEIIKRQK